MPVYPFSEDEPKLGERVFIAPGASVIGDVDLGDDVSVWFNAVVRGDVNSIRIGDRTNVQDGAVVHVTHERHATTVGRDVVIGHAAVLHGCRIEDGALIGVGARVLDGAVVETGAQIGAGALVAPGDRIPEGTLALGIPARVARRLRPEESAEIAAIAARYALLKERYRARLESGAGGSGVSRKR
jgi:carbonic anhydrase/acetyltransferase-like protein (isoleucine patch superfamily)